jgi:hypothetical protein
MTAARSYRFSLIDIINRLDAQIDIQAGRMGLMQRWLDDQSAQLDALSERVDDAAMRIEMLLARK